MTYAPVQKDTGGGEKLLIQYDMRNAETIGLMKMDFLGLANLSVLGRAVKMLKEYRGLDIDPEKLPLTDPKAYELLASGETTGLFQVESGGMRRYLKELKPSTILDVAAMIALYRPGPMENIPLYISRKHDPSKVEFLHPSLEPILNESFGVLVYQDDILFISIQIAGYDWEKADKLRKAVGKKDLEVLKAEEEKFVKGCQSHGGLSKADAQAIWEWMLPFARYGFNKSHAAAYAQITYQTAYLKANYPAEYMAAFLSTAMGDGDKVVKGVVEVKRMGASGVPITILPPNLNRSQRDFSIETVVTEEGQEIQGVRFGLAAVKNVGVAAIDAIIAARAAQPDGRYPTLDALCAAVDTKLLNKRVVESLIKAGALDDLGGRGDLLDQLDGAMTAGQKAQEAQAARTSRSLRDVRAGRARADLHQAAGARGRGGVAAQDDPGLGEGGHRPLLLRASPVAGRGRRWRDRARRSLARARGEESDRRGDGQQCPARDHQEEHDDGDRDARRYERRDRNGRLPRLLREAQQLLCRG